MGDYIYVTCNLCSKMVLLVNTTRVQWTIDSYRRVKVCDRHEVNQEVMVLG